MSQTLNEQRTCNRLTVHATYNLIVFILFLEICKFTITSMAFVAIIFALLALTSPSLAQKCNCKYWDIKSVRNNTVYEISNSEACACGGTR